MQWYRKAADRGQPDAKIKMGYMYEHGIGVSQDYEAALQWYRKVADENLEDADNQAKVKQLERLIRSRK